MAGPTPFKVEWSEQAVEAVLAKVRAYEFPPAPPGGGWNYGCDPDYLQSVCAQRLSADTQG